MKLMVTKPTELPEEYKMRFARIVADFREKHPTVPYDDIIDLMLDALTLYNIIEQGDKD